MTRNLWSTEARPKVGSRLIELLIKAAYIQPPPNQSAGDPADIRPADTLKNVSPENKKSRLRYGMIECEPVVIKGLEKIPNHMVIPYMPMLVSPENWTGYDKGAYLVLRSFVMRTHGSKHQREAIRRASQERLTSVFEVPLPERPHTEDESELKKWKWKVWSVKKENAERHSQRCDVELKLAVARKNEG